MPNRLCLALLALVIGMPVLAGQERRPDDGQERPTFRSEIRYVEVDAFVTDRDGAFVRDLTRADFELFEDGARQEVSTLTLVDLPIAAPAAAADRVDADVTTNGTEGRLYVLLLDAARPVGDAAAGGGLRVVEGPVHAMLVQRLARRFVEEAVGPGDVVAVLHAQGGTGAAQGFTSSRRLLLASIDGFGPAALPEAITPADVSSMMLNTYEVIRELSERLGAISGRRKAIVWIGGDVPFEGSTAMDEARLLFGYREAVRAATRNNVAIYPVDPRGLTTELAGAAQPSESLLRTAAVRAFAEDTGGIALVNTNNVGAGYERIVQDNSTYYLLGYYPRDDRRDGSFRPITVRVARPGVTVRARPGYFARDRAADASTLPPLPDGLSAAARDALRSPAPVPGLTLDLLATPFKGTAGDGSVLLGVQLRGGDLRLDPGERLELAYQAFDTQGRIRAGARKVFTLNFQDASRAIIGDTGLRYFDLLELPAGRHEIRFVAHQPGGATGSVVAHVEVPEFTRGPLSLSGIVLSSASTGSHRTLFGDPSLAAIVPAGTEAPAIVALPTPVRRFPRQDALAVYAELYGSAAPAAAPIRVVTTVTSENGSVVFTDEGQPAPGNARGDRLAYLGFLPLDTLSPGAHVLTLEAHAPGARAPVRRQVPFVITAD